MSLKVSNIIRKLIFTGSLFWAVSAQAQQDSLFLSVEQLFESGIKSSLQLQSDSLKERMAHERKLYAKTGLLPDLEIGLKGGIIGQPVVFQNGLSSPTYPDTPDWSQNYTVDFNQPLYQGGKIRRSIQKADIETEIARLQRMTNQADIKLGLLNQYLTLFTIRQMKKEGLITNNDVLRSEMQLTNDRLSLQETENSIHIVSQQLNLLLGNERNPIITPDTTLLQQATPLDSYDDYLLSAYKQAPDMQLLRKETELAQNQIEIDRASRRPNINLYASNTLARPITRTMTDLYNNNWNIGLSVSYPLSSLFKNGHKIKESQLQVAVQKKEEELKKQQLQMDIYNAILRHKEALQEEEAWELSVRQAQENYRIMQNRYINQLAILTDLLDANSVLLNAELQLTSSRTRIIYTYYQLQKACGRL